MLRRSILGAAVAAFALPALAQSVEPPAATGAPVPAPAAAAPMTPVPTPVVAAPQATPSVKRAAGESGCGWRSAAAPIS